MIRLGATPRQREAQHRLACRRGRSETRPIPHVPLSSGDRRGGSESRPYVVWCRLLVNHHPARLTVVAGPELVEADSARERPASSSKRHTRGWAHPPAERDRQLTASHLARIPIPCCPCSSGCWFEMEGRPCRTPRQKVSYQQSSGLCLFGCTSLTCTFDNIVYRVSSCRRSVADTARTEGRTPVPSSTAGKSFQAVQRIRMLAGLLSVYGDRVDDF